jgi:arabinan endo-1,5-alpha-L-arabinosidase
MIQPTPRVLSSALSSMLLLALTVFAATTSLVAQSRQDISKAARLPLFPEFQNPLTLNDPATGPGVSCPDPAIMEETLQRVDTWYLYCTGDPLNSNDKDANGNLRNHYIATWRSIDLIHWTYNGDVFPADPAWIGVETNLWAPAVRFFNGKYYLYYTAPETGGPGGPSEIGVATSPHAGGPWTDLGRPVVATESAPCCANTNRAVIDPDEVQDDSGQRYISFGSFFGGISIQKLSADGFTADPSSEVQIAVDNLYEGGSFYKHDGWFYLFASSTNCCNGPLSGYSVDVGRARTPLGPFLDRNGVALSSTTGGGSKVIAANGNRWVGPGGNVIFKDASGQDYMLYHAIDTNSPYFDLNPGFTRRPALIDSVDWVDGWPTVRNGQWASAARIPGPVAQSYQVSNRYNDPKQDDEPGRPIPALSDEFNAPTLSKQWHFIHPQADNSHTLTGTAYEVLTQGPDENGNPNLVSILGEPVPVSGNWMVETKVTVSFPFDGSCCYNFAQSALTIYGNDTNSIKLDVFADFDTRQTEFAKQVGPVPANYPTYGNGFVGSTAPTMWLRIARRSAGDAGERYTGYTSPDGYNWTRGMTWVHQLGTGAQIGISAQNDAGYTMSFDYVRVSRLKDDD